MNSNFKIPIGKKTQKRRSSPVQTFEALQPENMGVGYRQMINEQKKEETYKIERKKEINSLKSQIDAMTKSEQEQIRKHLLDLAQANNTISEINKTREENQFRPISSLKRTTSVLKDLDAYDENDDIEIPSEQDEIWKTSYSKGGRRGTRATKQKPIKRGKNNNIVIDKMEQKAGGISDFASTLLGVGRIRDQKYEKWLEQRLVLVHDDVDYVNEIRRKFGYDKTNIVGRGQLTKEQVEEEVCSRDQEDRELIDDSLKCSSQKGGYRKTKKHKRRGRKGKNSSRKHKK